MFRWWAEDGPILNAGLVALYFSMGYGPILQRNPSGLWFSWRQGSRSLSPLWICACLPVVIGLIYWWKRTTTIKFKIQCNNPVLLVSYFCGGTGSSARPPDICVYLQIIFLISQPKHMLWVLKRTISMRWFFWAPKHMFKLMGNEINAVLGAQKGPYLDPCWYCHHNFIIRLDEQNLYPPG